jgi:phosphate transport system substrate-binding protein
VALAAKPEGPYFRGTYDEVVSGTYPLSRFLYIYVNKTPGKPLDPLVHEFMKLVFSKEGQEVVVKDGYMPLTAIQCAEERARLAGVVNTTH